MYNYSTLVDTGSEQQWNNNVSKVYCSIKEPQVNRDDDNVKQVQNMTSACYLLV